MLVKEFILCWSSCWYKNNPFFKRKEEADSRVRSLAKEDSGARVTLAMLGAIPPLVGMLDFEDVQQQIASLYALLNLDA